MRLAVVSDIHGNLPALESAFSFIDKAHVDGIIWCGDYITDILLSSEVLEFIKIKSRQYNSWIVKGNREDYILDYYNNKSKDFGEVDASGSLLLTYKSLSKDDIDYISKLPNEVVVSIDGCPPIHVSHKLNNNCDYDYQVFGHIHKQCLFVKDNHKYINPGSVGQTFSGSPGIEFALLELIDGAWATHFYHFNYNLEYVINFIQNSDLANSSTHWDKIIIMTLRSGKDYIDRYINLAKSVAKKCGVNVSNMRNIPLKVWDYAYDKIKD